MSLISAELPRASFFPPTLPVTPFPAIARKSNEILTSLGPEIQWLHSYVTGDKMYCVYIAPDEALIREHAKRGQFPANRISAVRRLVDPMTAV